KSEAAGSASAMANAAPKMRFHRGRMAVFMEIGWLLWPKRIFQRNFTAQAWSFYSPDNTRFDRNEISRCALQGVRFYLETGRCKVKFLPAPRPTAAESRSTA